MSALSLRDQFMGMPQPARFLIAGGAAALLNWLVRFPLSWGLPFAGAVAVANGIGMIFGFVCYRVFVFPKANRDLRRQLAGFVVVNLLSMIVVVGISIAFAQYILPLARFNWHAEGLAHALGIAAGAVSNYFGHKGISFAHTEASCDLPKIPQPPCNRRGH